jgi:hypothetical protein
MAEPTNLPDKNESQDVVSDYLEGYQQLELQSAENNLKKTRNAIFAIAALVLVGNLIIMGAGEGFTTIGITVALVVTAIFVGLAFLTKKMPLTAIIIALVLFVGLWILDIVVVGAEYLFKGLLVRGIIIYFLVTGIKYARETERIRKEMNRFQRPG